MYIYIYICIFTYLYSVVVCYSVYCMCCRVCCSDLQCVAECVAVTCSKMQCVVLLQCVAVDLMSLRVHVVLQ